MANLARVLPIQPLALPLSATDSDHCIRIPKHEATVKALHGVIFVVLRNPEDKANI
jgi:hypothetical protein